MSRILHASTSLLRSQPQLRRFIGKVKEVAHNNVLLFNLSHDCPNLEASVRELNVSAKETIGCLSGPLPLRDAKPFFSCSVAVFAREGCVPFSLREAGIPPTQIGRWHAYSGGKPVDDGSEAIDESVFSTNEGWRKSWKSSVSSRFFPDELRDRR